MIRNLLPPATPLARKAFLLSIAGLCALLLPATPAPEAGPDRAAGAAPLVLELMIDDQIEPVLADYIVAGIEEAGRRNAGLVLIAMNTPGGLDSSMREIIQHILDSPAPVAVYVSPAGSRGASAGFYILLAADIAAMAPATHTGAASPLLAVGGYPVQLDETLRRKITNDAAAYLRSYGVRRGRNVELAETAITDAKAFTEKESLDGHLIDLIASSEDDLLAQLNGREVARFNGNKVRLALEHPARVRFEMTARQKFLSRIVQPDVFFILLLVGVLGLYTEFTHPGMIAPGVIGGICLVLALFAMHILPVNFAGLLLIFLALALFILEAKYTSHGVLGVGGAVAMLLGALFLIRSPLTQGGVSLGVALGATLPFAGISIFLMRLVLRSRKWKPSAGIEQFPGMVGEVVEPLGETENGRAKEGMVRIHSELWRARCDAKVPAGAAVRVLRVEGLTLLVEPAETRRGETS